MSKFFASGESDEEVESGEEDEEENQSEQTQTAGVTQVTRPTLVYSESESESDDEKRVVRSTRDKRFDAITGPMSALRNHLKINDWVAIGKDWELLQKALDKAKVLIAKEGIPPQFFATLLLLEKTLKEIFENKDSKKKMNAPNAKAFNAMRQKVKKEITKYSKEVEEYKKSPQAEEADEKKSTEDKKKDEKKKPQKPQQSQQKKKKAESEDEEEEDADDEDDEDEDEEDEDEDEEDEDEDEADKKKKPAAAAAKKPAKKEESDDDEEDEDEDEDEDDEDEDDEEEKKPAKKTTAAAKKKKESDDEDDDDEDEDEDEDESASDEDEDLSLTSADKKSAYFTREFWVKKPAEIERERKKREEDEKRKAQKSKSGPAASRKQEKVEKDEDDEGGEEGEEGDENEAEKEDDEDETEKGGEEDDKDKAEHSDSEDVKRKKEREAKKKKEKEQKMAGKEQREAERKGAKKEELSAEAILKKLRELLGSRGKRKTDRMALITHLRLLKHHAEQSIKAEKNKPSGGAATSATSADGKQQEITLTPAAVLKISTTLVSCYFDISLNKTDSPFIPIPLWREAFDSVVDILQQLQAHKDIRLSEDDQVEEKFDEQFNEQLAIVGVPVTTANPNAAPVAASAAGKDSSGEEEKKAGSGEIIHYVHGSLLSFAKLLHAEFRKSLLHIDHHSSEYVDRLRDEWKLVDLLDRASAYYQRLDKPKLQAKCSLSLLDLLHYHYTASQDQLRIRLVAEDSKTLEQKTKSAEDEKKTHVESKSNATAVDGAEEASGRIRRLSTFVYQHGDDKSKVRAVLYEVYHLALHNRWLDALDRFLSSHISDTAQNMDVKTQILFNRVQAQLGLCAFRIGEYRRALYCLQDLFSSQTNMATAKELLAQGVAARYNQQDQLSSEELLALKRRMLPFHQHINIDNLEAVHLICAMLYEVPNIARYGLENRKRVISRTFRRMLEHHLRQAFNGPPENTRDLIMAATKALRVADHEKALAFLARLRMFSEDGSVMYGGKLLKEFVLTKLKQKLQEDALKTWLLTSSHQYVAISAKQLQSMFSLDEASVRRISSKMMMNEELHGAWDEPTDSIVMTSTQLSSVQRQALAYADKLNAFVEANEKMVELRTSYQPRGDWVERGDRPDGDRPSWQSGRRGGGRQNNNN